MCKNIDINNINIKLIYYIIINNINIIFFKLWYLLLTLVIISKHLHSTVKKYVMLMIKDLKM